MNTFIEQLKRAFGLWWRFKILWPLGMLAALVGYGDGGVSGNFNVSQPVNSPEGDLPSWVEDLAQNQTLQDFIANPLPFVLAALLLVIGLVLIFALVGAIAHGALIRVADVADQGAAASIGDGLSVGLGRMTPIFLLNLTLALPVILLVAGILGFAIFAIVTAVTAAGASGGSDNAGQIIASVIGVIFCAIGVILLAAVAGAVLGVWSRVAQRVCVLEGRGPLKSLGRAWGLIRRNLGLTLITWFFQAILGGMLSTLLALPAAALTFPFLLSVVNGGAPPWGLLVGLFCYLLAANLLAGGLLTAFNSTLWTLIYKTYRVREQPLAYTSYGPG